uniref:Uncharacterized protein n=1 Tax=Ditylenchus dipsaci TaxID=166011 RepID=A0A915DT53_9BILA
MAPLPILFLLARKSGGQERAYEGSGDAIFADTPNITRLLPAAMNDLNLEEPSRYVQLQTCDFLIDLETPVATTKAPNYSAMMSKLLSWCWNYFNRKEEQDANGKNIFVGYCVQ